MALIHSPRTVIDGLTIYIDPANIKSYPGSGTTLKDLTSNELDLSATGTLDTATDAKAGTIYDLNGSSAMQTVTFTPISSLTWSIIWWIRSTGSPPSNYRTIIRLMDSNSGTGSNYPGYYWNCDNRTTTNSYIHEYQKAWNGTDQQQSWSAANIVNTADWGSQAWFCCGVSHDKPVGGDGVFRGYRNGSKVTTRTNSLPHAYGNINQLRFNVSSGNSVYMGAVSLYNRVLTDIEFKQIFEEFKVRFGY
tara:strand:+ start:824 stop:1567 length:744 start_codon:yes stop_codon:yes gene_type:complete